MIWDFVKAIPGQIWDFVKDIPKLVWNFFESAFSTLTSVFRSTYDFVITIPEKILEGIKRIFIPDPVEVQKSIDSLTNTFKSTFGIDSYDISSIFGTETEITDQQSTISIFGYDFSFTFLDVSFIVKAVTTFRPIIRGFIVFMLILYNINKFLRFIGQEGISLGGYIGTGLNSTGGDKVGKFPTELLKR